jgi:predicted Fe-Mo cluster-binding NifX family protein
MKIAVSSTGPTLKSKVDQRFGRAGLFLMVDDSTLAFEVINNQQNIDAAQGAGIQAARLVSDSGAEVVITGHCGPKAFQTLQAAGIQIIVGAEGTVQDMVEKYKTGKLKPSDSADVEGHWV